MISLNDVLLAMSNIPVDDPIAEIWGRGLQGGYRIIEYTGSLPITINANGNALLDYQIYGDDGGVGVATENLWNNYFANGTYESGGWRPNNFHVCGVEKIPIKADTRYSINYVSTFPYPINRQYLYEFDAQGERLRQHTFEGSSVTTSSDAAFCTISVGSTTMGIKPDDISDFMLVEGSTAPANYIPYGYKLPMMVSDGNTTQSAPVYIGENKLDAIGEYRDYVDFGIQKIARKIREYTFTGNETFNLFAQNAYGTCWVNLRLYTTVAYCPIHQTTLRSSHFTAINNSDADFWRGYPQLDDACNFEKEDGYDTVKIFFRSTANFSTAEECKAYFKEQYDNGTPVKIWFVMKYTVGQYESTDNGKEDPPTPLPIIPTIEGTTVIDYDGDPKPSQMYVKYKGKSDGA